VGVVLAIYCEQNTSTYRYESNVRYMLQRATAWIALFFIMWHVFHMHGWIHREFWLDNVARPLFGAQFDPERATSSSAMALASVVTKILYTIGLLATVFHLANGVWTAGITWGLWTTRAAQQRAKYVCAVFGVLLAAVGMTALVGMSTVDIDEARAIETVRIEERERQEEQARKLEEKLKQRNQQE
jgi:succinate dehydrogenase / fumarate reductase cytochrome b subunit